MRALELVADQLQVPERIQQAFKRNAEEGARQSLEARGFSGAELEKEFAGCTEQVLMRSTLEMRQHALVIAEVAMIRTRPRHGVTAGMVLDQGHEDGVWRMKMMHGSGRPDRGSHGRAGASQIMRFGGEKGYPNGGSS